MKWFLAWLVLMLVVSGCVFQPEYDSGVRIYTAAVELRFHPGKQDDPPKPHECVRVGGLEMATTTIVPASDAILGFQVVPTSPATGFDKVDESHLDPDYGNYVFAQSGAGVQNATFNLSVPEARNIGAVSSVRVYLAYYGYTASGDAGKVYISLYADNEFVGDLEADLYTSGANSTGYVDIPVSAFGQAGADSMQIALEYNTTAGGTVPTEY